MKLKALYINGFKSFANKTEIEFTSGIVSIVGPNGSGKSNVLDALRWVLGEQSAKSMRADKMEDVIFFGTQYKAAQNLCEVEIIFDNGDGSLDIDYSEVSIKRKTYRGGDNTFYLNNKVCRLKDIRELLFDSGIGKDGYSIIGQGRVEDIIRRNVEARRKLFEEACGISKYRYRQEESELNLEHSKDNLNRIEDIYSEIKRQIEPLYEQKIKAEKYIELKNKLKNAEISRAVKETANLDEEIETKRTELKRINLQISEFENERKKAEQQINILQSQLEKLVEDEKTKLTTQNDILLKIKELNFKIEKNFALKTQYTSQNDEIRSEISNIENSSANNKIDITALETEKNKLNELILNLKEENEKLYADKVVHLSKLKEKTDEFEKIKSENSKTKERAIFLKAQNETLKTTLLSVETELKSIFDKKNCINQKINKFKTDIDRLKEKISELEINAKKYMDLKLKLQNENKVLKTKVSESEKVLNVLDIELSTLRSRKKLNEDVQKEYEGMPYSVRQLMKRREKTDILDVVVNIIETSAKYETAVESALGGALFNVITDTSESCRSAIEILKKEKLGKVTFLPISDVKAKPLELSDEIILSEVVETNEKYSQIVKYLLGRTIFCETMDEAILKSRKYAHNYKLVTAQGEVFYPGGSISGGSRGKAVNLLSNRRILKQITLEYNKKTDEYEKLKTEFLKQSETLKQQNIELQKLTSEEKKIDEKLTELKADLKIKEKENISFLDNLKNLSEEYDRTAHKKQEILKRTDENITELKTVLQLLDESKSKLKKENEENLKYRKLAEETERLIYEKNSKLNIKNAELERLNLKISSYSQKEEENSELLENRKQRLSKNSDKIRALDEEIRQIEEEILKLQSEHEEESKKTETFSFKKSEIEKEKAEIQNKFKDGENLNIEMHKQAYDAENKLEKLFMNKETIKSRLEEEYGVDISEMEKITSEKEISRTYLNKLKNEIKTLGNVNLDAIEEYFELKKRFDLYDTQRTDLVNSVKSAEKIIIRLKKEMSDAFINELNEISKLFKYTFSELFGEDAEASINLEDEKEPLTSDIIIKAEPPGKKLKSINSMSGGEKAMTAIAALFAILMRRPAPFCFLDEIDAPLDDANVIRFAKFLRKLNDKIQFITITHRRGTMMASEYIYGVVMEEKGVSKILSMKLDEADKFIER